MLSTRVSLPTATPAQVLIAVASWDSASVVVFSFPAPPTANTTVSKPEDQTGVGTPPNSSTAVTQDVATWFPPWGESTESANVLEAREGGDTAGLTRALAFVRFGTGLGGMSLVAAAGDGTVAVAEWQGERGQDEWRVPRQKAGNKGFLRGTVVTTALFQVGRGPVRLEVFQSSALAAGEEKKGVERDDGDEERLFVNGEVMDAIIRRSSDAAEIVASDRRRGRWHCTQVGSCSRRLRQTKHCRPDFRFVFYLSPSRQQSTSNLTQPFSRQGNYCTGRRVEPCLTTSGM